MSEKVFGNKKQRSIKDIPLPDKDSVHKLDLGDSHGQGNRDLDEVRHSQAGSGGENTRPPRTHNKNKHKGMGIKIGITAVIITLAIVAYSYLFHSGSITVQERSTQVVLASESLSATVQSEGANSIIFNRVGPFDQTESIFVEGDQEENRQTKATGELTVYNTDPTEKNYIKNTRFKTESGLVYRAFNRFTIPAGSEENPGSTRVLVVAEDPGEKYNSENGHSFKLPALKEQGDPAYDAVSAEQAEPLSGGYSGVVMVPSEQDIQEAQAKLSTRLENDLFSDFSQSLDENQITFEVFTTTTDPTFTEEVDEQDGGVNVVARTQLHAIVFNVQALQESIAQAVLGADIDVTGVSITNLNELEFTLIDNEFDPETSQDVSFSVAGEGNFIWKVDKDELASVAAGKLASHIENNLVSDLTDQSITNVQVSPFWRRSLPNDPTEIEIIIESQNPAGE